MWTDSREQNPKPGKNHQVLGSCTTASNGIKRPIDQISGRRKALRKFPAATCGKRSSAPCSGPMIGILWSRMFSDSADFDPGPCCYVLTAPTSLKHFERERQQKSNLVGLQALKNK